MPYSSHDLPEEFPQDADRLQALKDSDPHFARLAEEYNEVNGEILRIETEEEAASDERLVDLRKRRLHIKDEIAAVLAKK
ncbi:MAG: YdcH family protein [Parvularculaceae bacterium]